MSGTTLTTFDPNDVPYQMEVIRDIRKNFDYKEHSFHEILLSGSVGSAKSILMAHAIVTHCLLFPGARGCLARRSMPDLKRTIFNEVLEHIDEESLKEGYDYFVNETKAEISFRNGSQIISTSWADKKYKKARSLKLSFLVVEELTENDDEDKVAYDELRMRVNRLPVMKGKENVIICATNPDSPAHWAYKHFIASEEKNRHVYYSVTTDNPFLPATYIDQLKRDLDPKMARRMLNGEWLEIEDEVVYYAYSREKNFRNVDYVANPNLPIGFTFDFNIAAGKPISCAFFQYDGKEIHVFDEVVVDGGRTENALEEASQRGLFELSSTFYCYGDAAGKHKDTRSNQTDYDIIDSFLRRYRKKDGSALQYQRNVPSANPPIRDRHNIVNAYCKNSIGEHRLFIYKKAKMADEGMRLVKLKPGSQYIEDDSKRYQHITTAIGYAIYWIQKQSERASVGMIKR